MVNVMKKLMIRTMPVVKMKLIIIKLKLLVSIKKKHFIFKIGFLLFYFIFKIIIKKQQNHVYLFKKNTSLLIYHHILFLQFK
jgi:hypothetical protein